MLSKATGISKSTISRIVNEGDAWLSQLNAICRVLGVDPVDILGGSATASIESREIVQSLERFSTAERYVLRSLLLQIADLRAATVETVLSAVGRPDVKL